MLSSHHQKKHGLDAGLMDALLGTLSSHRPTDAQKNAASVLAALARTPTSPLASTLASPEFSERLFEQAFASSRESLVSVRALDVCIAMLEPRAPLLPHAGVECLSLHCVGYIVSRCALHAGHTFNPLFPPPPPRPHGRTLHPHAGREYSSLQYVGYIAKLVGGVAVAWYPVVHSMLDMHARKCMPPSPLAPPRAILPRACGECCELHCGRCIATLCMLLFALCRLHCHATHVACCIVQATLLTMHMVGVGAVAWSRVGRCMSRMQARKWYHHPPPPPFLDRAPLLMTVIAKAICQVFVEIYLTSTDWLLGSWQEV